MKLSFKTCGYHAGQAHGSARTVPEQGRQRASRGLQAPDRPCVARSKTRRASRSLKLLQASASPWRARQPKASRERHWQAFAPAARSAEQSESELAPKPAMRELPQASDPGGAVTATAVHCATGGSCFGRPSSCAKLSIAHRASCPSPSSHSWVRASTLSECVLQKPRLGRHDHTGGAPRPRVLRTLASSSLSSRTPG